MKIERTTRHYIITFTEPILGTISGNPQLASDFIVSRHPAIVEAHKIKDEAARDEAIAKAKQLTQEEVDAIADHELGHDSTVFARDHDGNPMLWDYQVRGFIKEAIGTMVLANEIPTKEQKDLRASWWTHKTTVDRLIYVHPRRIPLILPNGVTELAFMERPLRADTMKGPRVALARSEQAPAGTSINVDITLRGTKDAYWELIEAALDCGQDTGIGQWRTGGWGQFRWQHAK